MSFIYDDKNLINDLIKSALDFENKFVKRSQSTDPAANLGYKNYLTLTRKLVDQLEQTQVPQPKDPNAPAKVSTELDSSQPLTNHNLSSFGNFLQFVEQNKITVDSQRVAYFKENPDPDKYKPVSGNLSDFMEIENRTDLTNSTDPTKEYFVNKDLMIKYLISLQALAKTKEDKILEVMVGQRIEDVNKKFRTNISKKYQEPEFVLSDDVLLTTFPEDLDADNYNKDGDKKLYYKDIKDSVALQSWVNTNDIGVIIPSYNKQGAFGVNDKEFDICVVVRTIYKKSLWLSNTKSTSPELNKKHQSFLKKIKEVGPTMQGPNGFCSISDTSSVRPVKQDSGKISNDPSSKDIDSPSENNTMRMVNILPSLFPFESDKIDFNKFKTFLMEYEKLDSNASSYVSKILESINKINNTYGIRGSQSTNVDAADIQTVLKDPDMITPYLIDLLYVVNVTGQVMSMFISKFGHSLQPSMKNKYYEQMGRSSNDASSLKGENVSTIRQWQYDASHNLVRKS